MKENDMPNKTYYQPEDFNGELPDELYSFQVFKNKETAMDWLWQHGYDADEWNIVGYPDDDIEKPILINEYGDDEE